MISAVRRFTLIPIIIITVSFTGSIAQDNHNVQRTISHQGFLVDDAGEPVDDNTHIFTFRIYADESGSDEIWSENQILPVNRGVFNARIGNEEPLDIPFDEAYWLGIAIDGGDELSPRLPLSATPYAMHAYSVEDGIISGQKIDDNTLQAGNNVTIQRDEEGNFTIAAETSEPVEGSQWSSEGSSIYYNDGNVGIGTDEPGQALDVNGNIQVSGWIGNTSNLPLEWSINNELVFRIIPADDPDEAPNLVAGHESNNIDESSVGSVIMGGGIQNDNPNSISGDYGVITGGRGNQISSWNAFIGGGRGNTASSNHAVIGGGSNNLANRNHAVIGGGSSNTNQGSSGFIGGGSNNLVDSNFGFVGGGSFNEATGQVSTIAGGRNNIASGFNAMIPGGRDNEAAGSHSLAAGRHAIISASHDGTFLWADNQGSEFSPFGSGPAFESEAENEFAARATGGVRFVTGINNGTPNAGVTVASGGSSWQTISDRNAKMAINEVNTFDVLNLVLEMPVSEYSYKSQDVSIRHMGPMAQDFHRLFGLGEDELRISAMNLSGIALASIQGLHQMIEEQDEQLKALREENSRLRDQIGSKRSGSLETDELVEQNKALEERLSRMEALLFGEGDNVAAN